MESDFQLSDDLKKYIDPVIADAIEDPYLYFDPEDFAEMLAGDLEEQGQVPEYSVKLVSALKMHIKERMAC